MVFVVFVVQAPRLHCLAVTRVFISRRALAHGSCPDGVLSDDRTLTRCG